MMASRKQKETFVRWYKPTTRKQKITAAAWFKEMFGTRTKRSRDDAFDSYFQILQMVKDDE